MEVQTRARNRRDVELTHSILVGMKEVERRRVVEEFQQQCKSKKTDLEHRLLILAEEQKRVVVLAAIHEAALGEEAGAPFVARVCDLQAEMDQIPPQIDELVSLLAFGDDTMSVALLTIRGELRSPKA